MKILCIYQFFSTGRTPDTIRPFRLCRLLAERGHDVTVLATDFNRHSGETEGPQVEIIPTTGKPLHVLRLPSVRNYRKGLIQRFLNYAGFSVRVFWKGFNIADVDLVLTSIPPTFVGPVGWLIARLRQKPFFLEIRDLWPDALEVKGAVKNRVLLRLLYALSHFLYRKAAFIVTVTYGIKQELIGKGIDPTAIEVLPNGFDCELFQGAAERDKTRQKNGWGNDFVAIYIGTLVEVTSMDTVVEAAEKLKNVSNIRFEIFGAGNTEPVLRTMIRDKGISNCRLNGTVAKQEVPALLNAADVCLMCLFETPLAHIYFQNKFFDYLGAGKPIVGAMKGHQRLILENIGAGMCVDPKDSTGLAKAVQYLAEHRNMAKKMGQEGKAYAMKYFGLDDILERYANILIGYASGISQSASPGSMPPLSPQKSSCAVEVPS